MTLGVCTRCGSHNFSLNLVPIIPVLPIDPGAECNDCKCLFVLYPQQHHAPCPRCKGAGEVVLSSRIESFSGDMNYLNSKAEQHPVIARCSLCKGRQWIRI